MRNCLTVIKFWRWQVRQSPTLIPGGSIPVDSLQRLWSKHDDMRFAVLTMRVGASPVRTEDSISMEQGLINGLTRQLRRLGRDPLGLGVIIDYLWRVQLAAHNKLLRQLLSDNRSDLLGEVLLL